MMKFASLVFLVSVAAECGGPAPTPTPPHPDDAPSCASACKKMQELGCKEGEDVPGPDDIVVTCVFFCEKTINENNVALNPSCIMGITSCDQIETKCAVGKRR